MPTITDYLQRPNASGVLVPVVGSWVQLTSNATATAYVSTAATDAQGTFTINNIPAGVYSVATGPTNTGPFASTGDTHYVAGPDLRYVNVIDFGAVGDNSTDNTTAFANAVAALPSSGGEVYIPGSALPYLVATWPSLAGKSNVRFRGAGPATTGGGAGPTWIRVTGSANPQIPAAGLIGIVFENIYFQWLAGQTGTFIDLSGATNFARVRGCSFFASGGGTSMSLIIGLDTADRVAIEDCVFHNCAVAVQGIATGGHQCNGIEVRRCNFSSSTGDITTAHIQNPGQGWLIDGNVFEMGTGAGTPNAIGQNLGGSLGVAVIGNWIGDAGTGAITAIDINGDGWLVAGNIVGLNSNAGSMFINQRSGANGLSVKGNRLQNSGIGITFGGSNNGMDVSGNRWNGVTTRYSGSPVSGTLESATGSGGLQVFGSLQRSAQTPTEAVLVSGVDATLGEHVEVTLTAARLVGVPLNPVTGQHLYFTLVQGGAGAFAVTWNAVFKVTWSNTGNATGARSTVGFAYDGTNWNQLAAQAPYV
jgi:hypothetical protein